MYWNLSSKSRYSRERAGSDCRQYIQQFLVNSSKVDFLAHRGLVKALYGGQHPGGRLVQEEDYQRITPAVLREFYDRYYHSNNCSIYLSGKVTDDCIRRIESLFGCEAFGTDFRKPEKTEFHPVTASGKRIFIDVRMPCKVRPYGHAFPGP